MPLSIPGPGLYTPGLGGVTINGPVVKTTRITQQSKKRPKVPGRVNMRCAILTNINIGGTTRATHISSLLRHAHVFSRSRALTHSLARSLTCAHLMKSQ